MEGPAERFCRSAGMTPSVIRNRVPSIIDRHRPATKTSAACAF